MHSYLNIITQPFMSLSEKPEISLILLTPLLHQILPILPPEVTREVQWELQWKGKWEELCKGKVRGSLGRCRGQRSEEHWFITVILLLPGTHAHGGAKSLNMCLSYPFLSSASHWWCLQFSQKQEAQSLNGHPQSNILVLLYFPKLCSFLHHTLN